MSRINNEVAAVKAALAKEGYTLTIWQKAVALFNELSYWTKNPLFIRAYENSNVATSESRPFEEAVMAEKELLEILPSLDQAGVS